jgi:hypothetical protein
MLDIVFVAKVFIVSLVILLLMQLRFGSSTLEDRAMAFVHTSSVIRPLREVSDGAGRMGRDGFRKASDQLGRKGNSLFRRVKRAMAEEPGTDDDIDKERD